MILDTVLSYNIMKTILIALFVGIAVARTYPLYKQCDPRWATEKLGTSPNNTICSAGCLMSSVSMALSGTGHDWNPSTLNAWLTKNGGYVATDLFVWASINEKGLIFTGRLMLTQERLLTVKSRTIWIQERL